MGVTASFFIALAGVSGKMVTLERTGDDPYRVTTGLADLEEVANAEKPVPPEYISEDGFGVTEAFRTYAQPLIMGEAEIEIGHDGLPVYARLEKHPLEEKTGKRYRVS